MCCYYFTTSQWTLWNISTWSTYLGLCHMVFCQNEKSSYLNLNVNYSNWNNSPYTYHVSFVNFRYHSDDLTLLTKRISFKCTRSVKLLTVDTNHIIIISSSSSFACPYRVFLTLTIGQCTYHSNTRAPADRSPEG